MKLMHKINDRRTEIGVSVEKLSQLSCVSENSYRQCLKGNLVIGLNPFLRLAYTLGLMVEVRPMTQQENSLTFAEIYEV